MLNNNEETLLYIKYKNKIEEIWQDQVDAGTWGRASLDEIIGAFNNLINKINLDLILTVEHKSELVSIIENKKNLAPNREKEILEAEESYVDEHEEHTNAFKNAISRYKALSPKESIQYAKLYKKLTMGYNIFFTVEELNNMFNGNKVDPERINNKYPEISKDLKEILNSEKDKETKEKNED